MVDQIAAQDLHLRVGSRLELGAMTGPDPSQIRRLSERVVGIMVNRGSVIPVTELDSIPVIITSHALYQKLRPRVGRLRRGLREAQAGRDGEPSSAAEAQALTRSYPATGGQIFVADEAAQAATVERSIRPQAITLALFALALAVTALLVVGQVASRQLQAAARDNGTLAALGLTRGQLLTAGLIEVSVAAAAGAVAGLRGGRRGLAPDADRPGPPGRTRPRPERRRPGADRRLRRDRDPAAGPGGLARLAAGVRALRGRRATRRAAARRPPSGWPGPAPRSRP